MLAILLAGVWISLSEFFRNNFLIHDLWIAHYQKLGIRFQSQKINNRIWVVWGIMLAVAVFFISRKFTLLQTTFLTLFIAFIMMWTVVGNLTVLPYGILVYAAPLSLLEVFIATLIINGVEIHKDEFY